MELIHFDTLPVGVHREVNVDNAGEDHAPANSTIAASGRAPSWVKVCGFTLPDLEFRVQRRVGITTISVRYEDAGVLLQCFTTVD